MKIGCYLITAIVQLVAAVSGFFILLLGLNGFSESEATPSLVVYIGVSALTVFGDGALGLFLAKVLTRKTRLGSNSASLITALIVIVFGVLVLIGTLFGGFILAGIVHDMR